MRQVVYVVPILFFTPSMVYADLPLTVEDLLSDKGKTRIRVSGTYVNDQKRSVDTSNPFVVQTGESSFVTVPTVVGENLTNTDVFVSTVNLGHGITAKDELYGRVSAYSLNSRSISATKTISSSSNSQFADAWIGINHKFRSDVDKAAILGFAELQIAEKQADGSTAKGKSVVLGATTYRTYDPLVLSLTGAVQINSVIPVGGSDIKKGNSLSLSPSVSFAVNDKVTLTGGVNWQIKDATQIDGEDSGIVTTRTRLNLSMGYALGKVDTLSFKVQPEVSGDGGNQISMNWNHRFGEY